MDTAVLCALNPFLHATVLDLLVEPCRPWDHWLTLQLPSWELRIYRIMLSMVSQLFLGSLPNCPNILLPIYWVQISPTKEKGVGPSKHWGILDTCLSPFIYICYLSSGKRRGPCFSSDIPRTMGSIVSRTSIAPRGRLQAVGRRNLALNPEEMRPPSKGQCSVTHTMPKAATLRF